MKEIQNCVYHPDEQKHQTGMLESFNMILWKKYQKLMQAHEKEGVVTPQDLRQESHAQF